MAKVTWRYADGGEQQAEVADGHNLMEAAVANNVKGIIGECGGNLSCATCHVYVHPDWYERSGEVSDFEDAMLDATEAERQQHSRLSCQIKASVALDGIVLHVPEV